MIIEVRRESGLTTTVEGDRDMESPGKDCLRHVGELEGRRVGGRRKLRKALNGNGPVRSLVGVTAGPVSRGGGTLAVWHTRSAQLAVRVAGPGNRVQVGRPRRPKAERHMGMGIHAVFGGSGRVRSGPPMIYLYALGWDRGMAGGPYLGLGRAEGRSSRGRESAGRKDAPREN